MLYSLARPLVRATRGFKNRLLNIIDSPVVILIYHRVTCLSSDPQLLAVSPENFRYQLKFLKDHFPLLRFDEEWGQVKEPSVVITFDDGYADNAREALPIIEEVGVPATFFVSSGNLGTSYEYWWDELERLIVANTALPAEFSLIDPDYGQSWTTGDSVERNRFYRELHSLMMWLDPARRDNWLAQLRSWAGQNEKGREEYRAMSHAELRRLAESRWVTIGAHTVSHTPLSVLAEESQREEILESKRCLETITGCKIKTFSYPFGGKIHYDQTSTRICREAGFVKVAANFPGQAHRWTDPMQLPRQLVRNWAPEVFISELKGFWTQ